MQELMQKLAWLLARIPASVAKDYDAMWDVGNAIKSLCGSSGFEDWKQWAISHESKYFATPEAEKKRWAEYDKMPGDVDGLAILERLGKLPDDNYDDGPCRLLRCYEKINAAIGDRLKFNILKSQIELNEKALNLDRLHLFLAREFNIQVSKVNALDIVNELAERNRYNPVVDYLEQVYAKYGSDVSILGNLSFRYLGTNEPIFDIFLMRFLIGAVARAIEPGCKMDNVLVLQGKQGIGKSSFLQELCGAEWFDDCFGNLSERDERMKLSSSWFIEWAELEATFRRRELASLKACITSQVDKFRPPYGYSVKEHPRHCVITATTNQEQFLSDETGNRRF